MNIEKANQLFEKIEEILDTYNKKKAAIICALLLLLMCLSSFYIG